MNKRHELRYIILVIFVVIAVVLGFVNRSVNQSRELNFIESMLKDSILFINKTIALPFEFIESKINDSNDKNNLLNKYNKIKLKEDKYNLQESKIKELETDQLKLLELLDLNKSISDYSLLNATTINRNLGFWYNTVIIDKGKNNGIKVDMAVIVNEGLIGKVSEVSNFSSTVQLLTSEDINNKISVKIKLEETDLYGILTHHDGDYFIVEGIDQNIEIKDGSMVVTTGMGGIFPAGVLIGKVSGVSSDHFDLAKTVYVSSFVDFDDIKYVSVIKRSNQW